MVKWLSVVQCPSLTSAFWPRRVDCLRGRRGRHSHISPADASYQPAGDGYKQTRALVTEAGGSPSASRWFPRCSFLNPWISSKIEESRLVVLLGKPVSWVDSARHVGVTFDTQLVWSVHINLARKKVAQGLGLLTSVLRVWSALSIRNGISLCKQLIHLWCPKHVETEVNNKHLIVASCCFFSLHTCSLFRDPLPHLVTYSNEEMHKDLLVRFLLDSTA